MTKQFYLQESTGYSGNFLWWWKKGCCGYTADITEAHVFTEEEALNQHRCRNSDVPWLKGYIDEFGKQCIDSQYVNKGVMVKRAGIKLLKPKRVRPTTGKTRHNCPNCGKIVWDFNPYDAPFCSAYCEIVGKYQ